MASTYLKKAVEKLNGKLTPAEELIGDYFIENERQLAHITLSELARTLGYSESTIYKFVKRLGFKGFPDFKIQIALNTNEEKIEKEIAFQAEDDEVIIAQAILQSYLTSLENLSLNFPAELLQKAADLLRQAKRIHIIGQGASKALALDAYHLFSQTHLHTNIIFDDTIELTNLSKFSIEDVFLIFTSPRKSEELLVYVQALHEIGAKIIVMTENSQSELGNYTEVCFIVDVGTSSLHSGTPLTRGLYLMLSDILYTCVQSHECPSKNSLPHI